MVMLSGIHYAISNQVSRPITHFEGRIQPLSLIIHGSYQKTIQGPQLPGSPGFGYFIPTVFPQGNTDPGFFKGKRFQKVTIIQIRSQGLKHSSTSWTTQLVQSIFHCADSRPTVHSQDHQICIDPKQPIQIDYQPSRRSLQLFTYIGHLFFPEDLFRS
ncbi:hypothetical protein O181_061132 [Austropuccinia psidii MF-1]|uniref:Uncharacterized protein n=1 Tax=Austropuccinia psidii MF-1 TaxID=1389203 RepID=A0A9Q3EPV3_9BASI|nr:hypothetical protein [Austropuccinia psidii MF-1]